MLALFALKIYFAVKFAINLIWIGRMDEEFLLQKQGQLKWETRVLSRQRKFLQNYYMMSIVHQRFTFIQCISLIWIFCDKLLVTVKLCVLLVYSMLLYVYLHQKMDDLLDEMNWKIRKWYSVNSEINLNGGKVYNQMHRDNMASLVASLNVSPKHSNKSSPRENSNAGNYIGVSHLNFEQQNTIKFDHQQNIKVEKQITVDGPDQDPQELLGAAINDSPKNDIN